MKEYDFCPANPLTRTQEEFVIYAMKEACRQTLELAADAAQVEVEMCWGQKTGETWVDRDSVLNVIKYIE